MGRLGLLIVWYNIDIENYDENYNQRLCDLITVFM